MTRLIRNGAPVENGNGHQEPRAPAEPVRPLTRRLLVVEDDDLACRQLQQLLHDPAKLQVDTTSDGKKALQLLVENNYHLVITDLSMPHLDGMGLIQEVQNRHLPVTVIVTTGHGSIEQAVQAMRMGAYDFLTKPIDIEHLRLVLHRALNERTLQDEVAQLREQLKNSYSFHNILSKNARMHAVFELIKNVADLPTTVLIEGETGTGKEQIARAIHQTSRHRSGPMIAVNCAALPENLLESELFGHEKGSFTSAVAQRRGRFELADGGTIFLDEVGDVPAAMQAKLLRVLQERCFERVGGTETIHVDVRVIAATNRSLLRLVKQGTFREDLYYRLNVIKIDLPPLRDRPEDIPLLARHFVEKNTRVGEQVRQITPQAMEVLLHYHWPGNIRELENAIERACVTSHDSQIVPENLPPDLTLPFTPKQSLHIDLSEPLPVVLRQSLAHIEQQYIRKALKKTRGNVGRCAKLCGLSRRSMSSKIAEYNIDKSTFKEL